MKTRELGSTCWAEFVNHKQSSVSVVMRIRDDKKIRKKISTKFRNINENENENEKKGI
jgi:hypothetical protein